MPTPRLFDSADTAYVEDLLEKYRANPESVGPEWQGYFLGLEAASAGSGGGGAADEKALGVQRFINVWRSRGHLGAWINPLQSKEPDKNEELTLAYHGLGEADMDSIFATEGVLPQETASLRDIREALHRIYGGSTGVETLTARVPAEREWVRAWWENPANHKAPAKDVKLKLFEGLVRAAAFEKLLHTKFVGVKRFSLEGNDAMIPLLSRLIETAAADGARHVVMGMAHRGRLNVLCNILKKPYAEMFAAFAETYTYVGGPSSGDVKYHMGRVHNHQAENGAGIELELMYNPSHLEAVNPVVLGNARAKAAGYGNESGEADFSRVVPVLMHGDSAVAGQGVVAECNNMMTLAPYTVGGTLHFVINNQLGFTADPRDAVSGDYCTDMFRSLGVPIVHVNADDIEACWKATRFAWEYRQAFGKDAVVDVLGYRRWGHNEGDDPTFTQPLLYALIKGHPTPADVYKQQLLKEGMLDETGAAKVEKAIADELADAHATAVKGVKIQGKRKVPLDAKPPKTAIEKKVLAQIAAAWRSKCPDFEANSKVQKVVDERIEMLEGAKPLNWGAAETAAYGALLHDGITVRLTGQDAERGTFSHRHAVLVDTKTGEKCRPMAFVAEKGARHAIHNSSLSENAIMGFEYGYALADTTALVLWEAQFGDFANGAQVIIDQFISSAEAKWGQMNGLSLLLPHGYEGQGPEHSSSRLERFLQLCGDDNMRVCVPSTPAQMFHLLRRQAMWEVKRPLIILTPKSLLRLPAAVSDAGELLKEGWQPVVDDSAAIAKPKRVVLCSGKVYYDLAARREEMGADHVALVRVEELYPWPTAAIAKVLGAYKCKDIWWVQEEPRNMGAWWYVQENWNKEWGFLHYAGRPTGASPASGARSDHLLSQEEILDTVFGEKKKAKVA